MIDFRRIPHLKLPFRFDTERLKTEMEHAKQYLMPYKTERIGDFWEAAGITDVGPSYRLATLQNDHFTGAKQQYQVTDLGEECPYAVNCVREIVPSLGRTRLAMLRKYSLISWHPHWKTHAIVQIPLTHNPRHQYQVTEDMETVYQQNYLEGDVWMFNTWYQHQALNGSHVDKYSIVIYAPLSDKKFYDMLVDTAQTYDGPLLGELGDD